MKQDCASRKRAVSGFTLLEIVIVIGIITILLGVLIPTMRTYMTKSRLNTANSNAKVIFNSLQTIMQEYEFAERSPEVESLFYGTEKSGNVQLYCVNGIIDTNRCSFTTKSGAAISVSGTELGADFSSALPRTLGARMNRLYTDYNTVTWCALIQDYSVAGVLCATSNNSEYIGAYPLQIRLRNLKVDEDQTYEADSVLGAVTNGVLAEYCEAAWGKSMVY